jgi:hypothetical protein
LFTIIFSLACAAPGGHPQHSTGFSGASMRRPGTAGHARDFPPCTLFLERRMNPTSELPNRFPVGTRYVIEGRAGRIVARFLEFPDGRRLNLTAAGASRKQRRRMAGARRAMAARSGT